MSMGVSGYFDTHVEKKKKEFMHFRSLCLPLLPPHNFAMGCGLVNLLAREQKISSVPFTFIYICLIFYSFLLLFKYSWF